MKFRHHKHSFLKIKVRSANPAGLIFILFFSFPATLQYTE